jgi:phage-related minor tail protein
MSSATSAYQANQEMNQIVQDLRADNVSIADIARAANLTHRAIARRLENLSTA